MGKPKILVIVGPTASGKSALAVGLAKKLNGEVISADSRQVYRGLNIGAGKITKREMAGVPHHLLDVASPKRVFTAAHYQKLAGRKIKKIIARGRLPIVCGGSGFYIDALVKGLALPAVKPNLALRRQLQKLTPPELLAELKKLDPRRAQVIDPHNPRRLIRAIEIAHALGRVPIINTKPLPYQIIKIGLKVVSEKLKEKIKTRLQARLKQGLLAEVKNLHQKEGLSWRRLEDLGLEYRYVALFLQNKLTKEKMLVELERAIWHYAKRQMTWFKRDKDIRWIDCPAGPPRLERGTSVLETDVLPLKL